MNSPDPLPAFGSSTGPSVELASFRNFSHSDLNTPVSTSPSPSSLSLDIPSLGYSPLLPELGFSNTNPHFVCPRHRSFNRSSSRPRTADPNTWSAEKQKRFENRLTRLTASAGLPLSWVDNTEWLDLCEEFIPAAKSPSRKTLTHRLLPATVAELRAEARAATKGHEATMQADGWTGTNNHHRHYDLC